MRRGRVFCTLKFTSCDVVNSYDVVYYKEGENMILIIDHFDSFTWNLYQYIGELGYGPEVVRSDISFSALAPYAPTHLILSPGEGHPKDVKNFHEALDCWKGKIPILGVCLGHQAIAHHFGATVFRNTYGVMHGKTSQIYHHGNGIFNNLPQPFTAMRYHSLVADPNTCIPNGLEITAWTDKNEVMAIQSRNYPHLYGVQFHPESYFTAEIRVTPKDDGKIKQVAIITHYGKMLLKNFLELQSTENTPRKTECVKPKETPCPVLS